MLRISKQNNIKNELIDSLCLASFNCKFEHLDDVWRLSSISIEKIGKMFESIAERYVKEYKRIEIMAIGINKTMYEDICEKSAFEIKQIHYKKWESLLDEGKQISEYSVQMYTIIECEDSIFVSFSGPSRMVAKMYKE